MPTSKSLAARSGSPPSRFAKCLRRSAAAMAGSLLMAAALTGCITDVSVTRHADTALTAVEARAILADFSAVVNTADSASDIACATDAAGQFLPAYYVLDGAVGIHNGPSVINGQQDFAALMAEPGIAKVVEAINWCGDFGPNIIGCAPIPGSMFAVVRRSASVEGILWAHEFGHSVGLEHRQDDRAVMRSTIGVNNRDITLAECKQYMKKVNIDYYKPGAAALAPVSTETDSGRVANVETLVFGGAGAEPAQSPATLREFVRTVYPHGTPMSQLSQMQAGGELPGIRALLGDASESLYWGNAVVVLGMLGDARDVPLLIQFANTQAAASEQEPDALGNASAALMALGYLANRTGDMTALSFLADAMRPEAWPGQHHKRQQLAITAHIGMAFSGLTPTRSRSARNTGVLTPELARELGDLNAVMASRGVRGYYQSR